jgi:hypothetical protein
VVTKDVRREQICAHHIIKTVGLAETQGFDISDWLRASILIAVSGPAAEARHTGRDIQTILNGYEGEGDLNKAKAMRSYAGLSASQIDDFIAEGIVRAKELMSRPDVWAAVISVANAIPDRGGMSGERVARLVHAACPLDERERDALLGTRLPLTFQFQAPKPFVAATAVGGDRHRRFENPSPLKVAPPDPHRAEQLY